MVYTGPWSPPGPGARRGGFRVSRASEPPARDVPPALAAGDAGFPPRAGDRLPCCCQLRARKPPGRRLPGRPKEVPKCPKPSSASSAVIIHRVINPGAQRCYRSGMVGGVDGWEWYDEDGWQYEAPRLDPHADRLTLALLEDLSNLLMVHGYQPLRGVELETMCRFLAYLSQYP